MNSAATLALTPLSVLYGIGIRLRNRMYERGTLRTHNVGVPVISVGNLTTGGTGKTPLVEWIAAQLAAGGNRVAVLTRGYRRASSGRVVVSDYTRVLSDAREAGDEPFLLAQNLAGRAAVICDANRVAAARWAVENLGSNVFVLDDAYQHQRIKRDLNVLTIDATNPWGNRKLLPAGILRDPMRELRRADCILITRANESSELDRLRNEIQQIGPTIPVFSSNMKATALRSLDSNQSAEATNYDRPVAAFCGIGNPTSFFSLLRREGYKIAYTRAFRDHHAYAQMDIDQIIREAREHGTDAVVTTAKDAVKLKHLTFGLPCYVADMTIEIDDASRLLDFINRVFAKASR